MGPRISVRGIEIPRFNSDYVGVLADEESRNVSGQDAGNWHGFFVRQDIGEAAREAGLTSEGFQSLGRNLERKSLFLREDCPDKESINRFTESLAV
jgi:hypothetical protein